MLLLGTLVFQRVKMPTPTKELQKLLSSGTAGQEFKQSAMVLARQGADITVRSTSGAEPTLLHVLARQNENGANNNEITELVKLNADVVKSTDYYHRTALQSLMDALIHKECSFADFKQSAMILARQGADITLKATAGAEPTLLHILARQNENGANNNEIAKLVKLNADILKSPDYNHRTALQSLMDTLIHKECSFANFKQSAMTLAESGADITRKATAGAEPTLLHILARQNENGENNNEIIKLVGLDRAILASTDYYRRTALQSLLDALIHKECSFANFKQSAMILAEQGADITLKATAGAEPTLLHILARQNENGANNNEIAKLVKLNADILKSPDYNHRTALQSLMDTLIHKECSFANFKQSAMTLAESGADITRKATAGAEPTLLHILARQNENGENNNEIIKLVGLDRAILASTDYYRRTALQSLMDALIQKECSFANFKQSAMILAQQGANLALQGTAGAEPTLLHALVLNNIEENNNEINTLIELNSNVLNFKDYYGRTPIHSLLNNKPNVSISIIEKLLSVTNLHLKDNHNATLLHAACSSGNLPAVEYFFNKGLSLTALTKSQETLIHHAASSGNTTLIQWLIDTKQIDINAKDQFGETALHRATRQNNLKVIKLLNCNGADLTIRNNESQKASEIATHMGYPDLVPYLVKPIIIDPKKEFFHKIQAMHDYGVLLKNKGVPKGQIAIDLANKLTVMANEFFEKKPEERNFSEFKPQFLALLHSKDKEMSAHRNSWKTIIANIAIALTGVGLLLIAGQLIHSKVTENRALFFFQKSKTTSEEKIADVEHALNLDFSKGLK